MMRLRRQQPGQLAFTLVLLAGLCAAQSQSPPRAAGRKASSAAKSATPATSQKAESPGKVQELFQQAAEMIERERYSTAVPLLREALDLAPNEGRVHHYLGYALWKDRQVSAATAEFERALKLEPGNVYTRYFLARIAFAENQVDRAIRLYESIVASGMPIYDTYQRLGQAYLRVGNLTRALDVTQQALQQTPWDGALHYQLGKIYRQMGRLEESKQEFDASERLKRTDQALIQKLLELSQAARNHQTDTVSKLREEVLNQPIKDPEMLIWLGILLGQADLYQESLVPLQQAVEMDPGSYEAHYNFGMTLVRLERYQEAEASIKQALAIRPESFEANSVLGVLYADQNRNREAIERLRVAKQARPDNLKVLALLGQQYLQGRYVGEAVQTLRAAARLKPGDPTIRYLLIDAYQKSKDYENAFRVASEALKFFPKEARAHYEVGVQMANLGRYQEARPYFEEAIRLDASFAAAYNWLGDLQLRKGEYEAAWQTFQKARNLEPESVISLRGVGRSLVRLRRYQEAVTELERAIQIHPDDAELHFQLSQAYTRLGDREKAAQAAATFDRLRAKEAERELSERPRTFEAELSTRAQRP